MKNLCSARIIAIVALAISFTAAFATPGAAYDDGIVGASGKDSGYYCRNHHVGGTVPTVAFEGPTVVTPGAMATFRFAVTSNSVDQIAAGLDVAPSAGTLGLVDGQGTRLQFNEVTHSQPKANDTNGEAAFEFTWQAPEIEGTYTLYGAGCSVNLDGLQTGDAAARTTYEIVVGVGIPTPTPTAPLATPTATPGVSTCVGDCNGDGSVTVDEIITGVNIALGITPVSACLVLDANDDGSVTVDEILQAVNNALNGCPAA